VVRWLIWLGCGRGGFGGGRWRLWPGGWRWRVAGGVWVEMRRGRWVGGEAKFTRARERKCVFWMEMNEM
jgi:hypothetical protein